MNCCVNAVFPTPCAPIIRMRYDLVCSVKLAWDVELDVLDKAPNSLPEDTTLFVLLEMNESPRFTKPLAVFSKVLTLYKSCSLSSYKIPADLISRRLGFLTEFLVGKLLVRGRMSPRSKSSDSLILGFFMEVDRTRGRGDTCRVLIAISAIAGLGTFLCLSLSEKLNPFIRIDFSEVSLLFSTNLHLASRCKE